VIGVSADNKGKVSVVMQLMEGDLRNFINNHRDYERVSYRDFHCALCFPCNFKC